MGSLRHNLLIQFAVVGFAVIVVIGAALALVLAEAIRSNAVDDLVEEAVGASSGRLAGVLTPADFETPMTDARYERFREFVQRSIVSARTARVKLWAPDGTVIFSDDPAGVGEQFPTNENLLEALRGKNATEIKLPTEAENERERFLGTLMEIYTPIRFPGSSEARGVLEIYQYYQPTEQRIQALQGELFASLGAGLVVLYGGLVSIVWGGWRTIKRQQASLVQTNTDLLSANEEVAQAQGRLALILDSAGEGIYGQDMAGRNTFANPAAATLLGWEGEHLLGEDVHELVHHTKADGKPYPREECPIEATARDGAVRRTSGEVFWRKDGTSFPVEFVSTPFRAGGQPNGAVVTFRDITERQQAEERIRYLAYYDTLTGLPNRRLFEDRIAQELARSRRAGILMGILLLDLDRFQRVNDTLGHAAGDRLLQRVAERLRLCVREYDTVARLGGDEFLLLLGGLHQADRVLVTVDRIRDALRPAFDIDGHELHVTASIGVSIYPHDGLSPETLISNADTAMYRVKDAGRDGFQLYTEGMSAKALERLEIEAALMRALERQEFVLHYQPLLDLSSGEITGMEALVRWQHPERGLVPPMEFIPLAEDSGLIVPLGEWVLRSACAQTRAWQTAGLGPLRVAVNLAARQWEQPNFVPMVSRILEETGLDPSYLELEITESVAMRNAGATARLLQEIHASGVHISLDDFGTGYSSLGYLKQFALQRLKIDRSFVTDLTTDTNDQGIASAIIALGHALQLNVLAEGVETTGQLDFLRHAGCDAVQGYLFSRPLNAEAFGAFVGDRSRRIHPPTVG